MNAGLRKDFGLLPILFIGVRLTLLMTLPAEALFQYGDFHHYYTLAAWSLPGHCLAGAAPCWPLVDYWYEFPPVFPYLSIAIVQLGAWAGGGALLPFHAYAYGLALVMLAADVGSLFLLRQIAAQLYGAPAADTLAWIYALMPAPLILSGWTFDSLTVFWMLLALWALLKKRDGLSAAAIGVGVMTKLVPVLLLPVIWRVRPWRRSLALTAGVAAISLLFLTPFLWRAPQVTVASLAAQASKSSYATVWAMLDGNLQTAEGQPITGNFGTYQDHFDLARATVPVHRPAAVPGWLTLVLFGALYLWVWHPPSVHWGTDQGVVTLFAFTWAIFVLWSKGWSPQWQQMLVPLILLTFPNWQGVLLALLLAAVSFLEWPVLLARGWAWGYWLTIPLRTLLFVGWAIALGRMGWRGGSRDLALS